MAETQTKPADGDKTGGEKAAQDQAAETQNVVDSDPTAVNARVAEAGVVTSGTGDDAVVLKLDGTIEGSLFKDAPPAQALVTLEKDVVEEFRFPGTARPAYRIRFTKGQTVPKSVIDEINARAKSSGGEEKLSDYVDSTTVASGTGAQRPKSG